jgi:hypothetical protein
MQLLIVAFCFGQQQPFVVRALRQIPTSPPTGQAMTPAAHLAAHLLVSEHQDWRASQVLVLQQRHELRLQAARGKSAATGSKPSCKV